MDFTATTNFGPILALAFLGPIFALIIPILSIAVYIYIGFSLQAIAKKTNTDNSWFAWIPILNLFLMVQISGKPVWWFVLLLIPGVNLVIFIILWMEIAKKVNKPTWWGLLLLVPGANLIVPGYLAFAK